MTSNTPQINTGTDKLFDYENTGNFLVGKPKPKANTNKIIKINKHNIPQGITHLLIKVKNKTSDINTDDSAVIVNSTFDLVSLDNYDSDEIKKSEITNIFISGFTTIAALPPSPQPDKGTRQPDNKGTGFFRYFGLNRRRSNIPDNSLATQPATASQNIFKNTKISSDTSLSDENVKIELSKIKVAAVCSKPNYTNGCVPLETEMVGGKKSRKSRRKRTRKSVTKILKKSRSHRRRR